MYIGYLKDIYRRIGSIEHRMIDGATSPIPSSSASVNMHSSNIGLPCVSLDQLKEWAILHTGDKQKKEQAVCIKMLLPTVHCLYSGILLHNVVTFVL